MPRLLIVNADDLGYDPAIDRGILEAAREGIVTSTTCLAGHDGAERALAAAEAVPTLGIGLHVDLSRWPSLEEASAPSVEQEIEAQLARFVSLARRAPTHLDFHKHLHRHGSVLQAAIAVARRHALPVRAIDDAMRDALRRQQVATPGAFVGDTGPTAFWTVGKILAALESAGEGVTELMCHPGHLPEQVQTSYGAQREAELAALLDPRVLARARMGDPRLVDFRAVTPEM